MAEVFAKIHMPILAVKRFPVNAVPRGIGYMEYNLDQETIVSTEVMEIFRIFSTARHGLCGRKPYRHTRHNDMNIKPPNSRMCFICGLENPVGLHLHIYETGPGNVETKYTAPPVPLLWVLPLGLYLFTWIVALSPAGRGLVRAATRLQDVMAVAAVVIFLNQPYALVGPLATLAALVVVGLAQHGTLAASAPPTAWLPRFYVLLALGGALGTALVVAIGPTVFPLSIEAPVALAVAVALGAPAGSLWTPAGRLRFLAFAAVATVIPLIGGITRPAVLASASIGAGVLAMRWRGRPRLAALALAGLVGYGSVRHKDKGLHACPCA